MAPITQTEDYLIKMRSLVENEDVLQKHGYIVRPLTAEELLLKRRCLGCGKTMSQLAPKKAARFGRSQLADAVDETMANITASALSLNGNPLVPTRVSTSPSLVVRAPDPHTSSTKETVAVPVIRCKYHPGQVIQKHWTCCAQHVTAKPCGGSERHNPRVYGSGELSKQHQFHCTPLAPPRAQDVRVAVALDCEMGTGISGDPELIRVTLVDYFSEAVLVDNIVEPDVPMQHLNTRFSGVSWADIRKAKRQGSCLRGKAGARKALWRYVGPETLVVGHGLSSDLRALRWIHGLVVDSHVIEFGLVKRNEAEKEAAEQAAEQDAMDAVGDRKQSATKNEGSLAIQESRMVINGPGNETATKPKTTRNRGSGNLSLKNLVRRYLLRDIQMGGKSGHDSLEDAIAARDLVHWMVTRSHLGLTDQATGDF